MFRERPTVAGLAQLAGYLLIVIPAVVTIAFAAPAVSAGLRLLQPGGAAFQNGYRTASAAFFYLCPQMLYLALFVLYFLFCAGQCRMQERLSLYNEAELNVFLAKRVFQRSDTGEIILTHYPI